MGDDVSQVYRSLMTFVHKDGIVGAGIVCYVYLPLPVLEVVIVPTSMLSLQTSNDQCLSSTKLIRCAVGV